MQCADRQGQVSLCRVRLERVCFEGQGLGEGIALLVAKTDGARQAPQVGAGEAVEAPINEQQQEEEEEEGGGAFIMCASMPP